MNADNFSLRAAVEVGSVSMRFFYAVSPHGDTLTGTRESPVLLLRSPLEADCFSMER